MKRRTPRGLNPDEEDLWEIVARTTRPMHSGKPKSLPEAISKAGPQKARRERIEPFEIGTNATVYVPPNDLSPTIAEQIRAQPVKMDKKAFRRLQRGQSRPEARLDLHGMTAAAAQEALTTFIHAAFASGKRLVLVITGKGRQSKDDGPIPTRTGVLKHQVPQWLGSAPLAPMILQVSQAHQRHGGGGALYVYLRRK